MDPRHISVNTYDYILPEEQIATYPTVVRDESKLLICNGDIRQDIFKNIADYLPGDGIMVFNNTLVVEARLHFKKPTGAQIEIFCLEPSSIYPDISTALSQKDSVEWKCLVGNASAWNNGLVLEKKLGSNQLLKAQLISKLDDHFIIRFFWSAEECSFAEILHEAGMVPLPPYIKRRAELNDSERYQTIYATVSGSVAAPTAGLHFTQSIVDSLITKNIKADNVTLHVSAGTFKPVKSETMGEHNMHAEFIEVSKGLIENIYAHLDKPIIAVGTTSLRTLESIYWIANKVATNQQIKENELVVEQWDPYETKIITPVKEALESLIKWMETSNTSTLITKTSLLIVPSYSFKIVNVLVTNFHQPRSTLLLLVAAFIGESWKDIYNYALNNRFRFLSYGDASLLFRK